jgi:hypothetical protein
MTDTSPGESALTTVYEATSNFLFSVYNLPRIHSTLPTVINKPKNEPLCSSWRLETLATASRDDQQKACRAIAQRLAARAIDHEWWIFCEETEGSESVVHSTAFPDRQVALWGGIDSDRLPGYDNIVRITWKEVNTCKSFPLFHKILITALYQSIKISKGNGMWQAGWAYSRPASFGTDIISAAF